MSRQVGVALGPDRRPVAVKRVTSASGAARLAHEVGLLHAARHPGVVAVVGYEPGESDGGAALRTAWVAGGSLASRVAGRSSLAATVRVLASVADTVADLHERGIVHGRLGADHVLVAADGAAVLTGFADAEQHGERPVTDDVADLGRLVAGSAATMGQHPGPRLGRRSSPGRRRRGEQLERLAAIGERAADPLPTRRPSARALARQLAELSGELTARHRRLARPRLVMATAAVATVATVAVVVSGRLRPPPSVANGLAATLEPASAGSPPVVAGAASSAVPPGALPTPAGTAAPPPTDAVALTAAPAATNRTVAGAVSLPSPGALVVPEPTPAPPASPGALFVPEPTPAPPASSPPATPAGAASTTGPAPGADPPDPEITIAADGRVRVDDATYQLDVDVDAGDRVLVGDWDCDGQPTLAVVRLPSGAVDVFTGWPAADAAPVAAVRLSPGIGAPADDATRVAGSESAEGDGARCDAVAVRAGGTTTVVAAPPAEG